VRNELESARHSLIHKRLLVLLDQVLRKSPRLDNSGSPWSVVRDIARRASDKNWPVFLIGGAVRDLILGGIDRKPRDFDLVFCNVSRQELTDELSYMAPPKRTRFGGLRYTCKDVLLDIWPLDETVGPKHRNNIRIQDVPKHAFLDVEAIAVEVSPGSGKTRQMIDYGFTNAIRNRSLGINYEPNPFPEVCIVKALRMAITLDFQIERTLIEYILKRNWNIDDLVAAQQTHYGQTFLDKVDLQQILDLMARSEETGTKLTLTSNSRFRLKERVKQRL
jgi:hypothetical protein